MNIERKCSAHIRSSHRPQSRVVLADPCQIVNKVEQDLLVISTDTSWYQNTLLLIQTCEKAAHDIRWWVFSSIFKGIYISLAHLRRVNTVSAVTFLKCCVKSPCKYLRPSGQCWTFLFRAAPTDVLSAEGHTHTAALKSQPPATRPVRHLRQWVLCFYHFRTGRGEFDFCSTGRWSCAHFHAFMHFPVKCPYILKSLAQEVTLKNQLSLSLYLACESCYKRLFRDGHFNVFACFGS